MTIQENDDKLAEKIFGSTVPKIKATGGHRIQLERILEPLEWKEAVMRAFCEDCGFYVEINREIAERYVLATGVKLPDNPKDFYFHSKGCALCDSKNSGVKLVPLPKS